MTDQFSLKYHTNKLCVIISRDSGREGNVHDRESLVRLFTNLAFEVISITEPQRTVLQSELNKLKKMCEKGDIGLLVVFVLSHGDDEKVFLTDSCSSVMEIKKIIENFNVENLKGKPKLFFFQACRGGNFDKGRFVDCKGESGNQGASEVKQLDFSKLTVGADTLVAHATIPGCQSSRTENGWGSYFIYFIYQVFCAHSATFDVLTMLTLVNRFLATKVMFKEVEANEIPVAEDQRNKEYVMQMPSFKSQLTRKVFLSTQVCPLKYGPLYRLTTPRLTDEEKKRLYSLATLCRFTKDDLFLKAQTIFDYPNDDKPGLCIIFSNTKIGLKERIGLNKDVENLEQLFRSTLGYNVKNFPNLDKNEILKTLTDVMANKIFPTVSVTNIRNFIVIMLTNGNDDKILAQDQEFLVDDLVEPIKKCEENNFKKIPKLFLIQADGLNLNKTLEYRNNGKDNREFEFITHDGKHLPSEANMLFMYSNVPARSEEGTPLVKHFCDAVSNDNSNNDMLSILTVVNRKISEEIMDATSESVNNGKEMPFFVSRLIDKVFLRRNRFEN